MKDMQAQLEKEGKEDTEVYEKVTCWCETNDKDKTTAISDAESRITELTSTIEEATASTLFPTCRGTHFDVEEKAHFGWFS